MVKKSLLFILLIILVVIAYFRIKLYPQLPVANGYAAKKMCSCTFISNRDKESIQKYDLGFGPMGLTSSKIDLTSRSATSSIFGLVPRTAVYRDDVGCILLDGKDDKSISLKIDRPKQIDSLYWPLGTKRGYPNKMHPFRMEALNAAIESAFDNDLGLDSIKTKAVVVVYDNHLITEKYAVGFDSMTEIGGWSMTKSVTSALSGILMKNGTLNLDEDHLFSEWQDERNKITLKDLLQMQSGLEFHEDYTSLSDANKMLFISGDVSAIPMSKELKHAPGTHWYYSSGTTNLISRLMRNKLENHTEYLKLPYDSLFNRIGMASAVMETDEYGTYIGSSFCFATPSDWAKFGLLFLNQGNWYGVQVVDTSFVNFVRQPAEHSNGVYGGHFWLNIDQKQFPDAPEDLFMCNGFQGQHVYIIPSKKLVVVRMGLSEWPDYDGNKLLKGILESMVEV